MKCPSCGEKPMDQTDTAFICKCGATVKLKQWADINGRSTVSKPAQQVSQSRRSIVAGKRSRAIVQESRAERIAAMIDAGESTATIASACGVSQRWVQLVVRGMAAGVV